MSNPVENGEQREFRCVHCNGKILVPASLPATTGPCPHCQKQITSPRAELPPELDPIFGRPVLSTPASPAPVATPAAPVVTPPPMPDPAELAAKRRAEEQRLAAAKLEAEREADEARAKAEQERLEAEQAEQKRQEAARLASVAKAEEERLAAAKLEDERIAKERAIANAKAEQERLAAANFEQERIAKERAIADAKAVEEREIAAAAAAAQAKATAEQAELERQAAAERVRHEKLALEQAAQQKAEEARLVAAKEAEEAARRERETAELRAKSIAASSAPIAKVVPEAASREESVEPEAGIVAPEAGPEIPAENLEDIKATVPPAAARPKRKIPVKPIAAMLVLIALAVAAAVVVPKLIHTPSGPIVVDPVTSAALQEQEYLKSGWEVDARRVLSEFLAAETVAGKASHVIRSRELLGEMESYYGEGKIDDSDTPESAFSVYPLNMDDKRRGIFMLTYDQPPAYELSEFFTPLAPLAVKYQLREPDMLLAAFGRADNFTAESLRVQALFKRSSDGMKLDWETFVQTKYRTLRDFLDIPEAGRKKVFRVIVSETVPEKRNAPAGHRTYLIADPAHRSEDSARVYVAGDSNIGRAFSILNWRGTKEGRLISKTATLELAWSNEATPQLSVSRFICWEFLGVGGEAVEP